MELQLKKFREIDLNDAFFDSLKADYEEFTDWFLRKSDEQAYIFETEQGNIGAFLYLKLEDGPVTDVTPALPNARRLKVGTMKINPHGTKMGERFIKKILDHAIHEKTEEIYVTVFQEHEALIGLFERYGFRTFGTKTTPNGTELVLIKYINDRFENIYKSYPLISLRNARTFILSLYPNWHTRLLPDSILKNENSNILEDISSANSIHKVYLTAMKNTGQLRHGDIVAIYRTNDGAGHAHYRSVVTSIGVIEDCRHISSFASKEEFFRYCKPHSVFTPDELEYFWKSKKYPIAFKFTYNISLKRKVTRGYMIEQLGIPSDAYWGFLEITHEQLKGIAQQGKIDESLIID